MDLSKAGLVVCLTLFIVVGVNAALYVMLTRKSTVGQIELLRRAASRARQPWQSEDDALQELSQRVSKLKGENAKQDDPIRYNVEGDTDEG